ncbi:MAG: hydrogenase expression/formation protein [Candidatus Tectomicrobia bacterium]|uniref:Hydrogenase expression/formation protein n=1 Tax=Tectimicrobiota bacterium TaxID=2528274 RepID=A0A933GMM4_UNCTE|nr:hydrogenase expression/formation protein [Candidatus Tectomicrobia bacterium]
MMDDRLLPLGKLKSELLEKLLKRFPLDDPAVLIGPKIGEDAAVIDFGDQCLVLGSDPVTFTTREIGWYAMNVNANDIAVMGARPRWFLATVLLPENKTSTELVESIFSQLHLAGKELGISIVGGHTEITSGIEHPIVVGSLIGQVARDKLVTSSGAKIGDDVVLIKGIAIEGTSIIAREKEKELLQAGFSKEFISKCQSFLHNPGISVLQEALIINEVGKINCMHDPTESGLAGGIREIALASEVGMVLRRNKISIYAESKILCNHFGLDPLGLIASGALLCTLDISLTPLLASKLIERGISFSVFGRVVEQERGLTFEDMENAPLPIFDQDEITKVISGQGPVKGEK